MNAKEYLDNLQKFFDNDLILKEEIMGIAPSDAAYFNEDALVEYSDSLSRFLKKASYLLESMCLVAKTSMNTINSLKDKIKTMEYSLAECGTNYGKLKEFYQTNISDLSLEVTKETNDNFAGYIMASNSFEGILSNANTINEMLHILHSYVMNNEDTYHDCPLKATKNTSEGRKINLYGYNNFLSESIYNNFPDKVLGDPTDILALNKEIFIMIRGLGHALTISITYFNDKINVNYFIPKICNVEMINKLKGVNKVSLDADFRGVAFGLFQTNKDNILNDLYTFIMMVPTDDDIELYSQYQR